MGYPSKGTPADKRLAANRPKASGGKRATQSSTPPRPALRKGRGK